MARFVGNIAVPSRQEIWWVRTQVGVRDGKPLFERKPWLVIQDNSRAEDVRWPRILALRITGDTSKDRPSHVRLGATERFPGIVLCETLEAVPRWRFLTHAGTVSPGTMRRVESAVRAVLGMEPS
jgi:mRNA-degrading endonuclease toxin of MazEF toxin-antitoxin module